MSALLLSGCARPPKSGLSDVPDGVRNIPGVYVDVNPRWSHDGKRIAFMRSTPDRRMQLHVADEDLDRARALLTPELLCPDRPYSPALQRYSSPDTLAWAPNDRYIAFERIEWYTFEDGERLPGTALWFYDTHTRAVQPLALHTSTYKNIFYYYHAPAWSPDGRRLAFVGEGINGQRVVFVHSLRAQNAKQVTPRFDTYEDSDWPAWRFSSLTFRQGIVHPLAVPPTETLRKLSPGDAARGSAGEMWRVRAQELRKLLPQWEAGRAVAPRSGHPTWSPDGRQLVFTLTPDANDYDRYALWVLNAAGTGARRVSPSDGRGYLAPVWIGRGRLGALSPQRDRFKVVTIDVGTSAKRVLGSIATSDCDWSPDRSEIAYAMPPDVQTREPADTTLRLFATGLHVPIPIQPALNAKP